jgi:DNA-binding transcriptional LysR family regulator
MDRARRVANLWSWLPVFRAVAETEHLRLAADRMHISPSALSRTIKLLEEDLGRPLFERVGRGLRINDAGEVMLAAVRDAMRLVHDASEHVQARHLGGTVRITAAGTLTTAFVVPALERLREAHPKIVPVVDTTPLEDPARSLLQGDVDLVFSSSPVAHESLTTRRLGESSNGVYCGAGHPLFGAKRVDEEELGQHPFVAPPPGPGGAPAEGWPVELERSVACRVTSLWVGLEIVRSTNYIAVFPDLVVRREVERGDMYRLPFERIPPVGFFAAHRPTLGTGGRTEAVMAAVEGAIEDTGGSPS